MSLYSSSALSCVFSFRNGNNTAHNTAMRRKEREKELEELQKKDRRKGRGKIGVEDTEGRALADQSNSSQHILSAVASQPSVMGVGLLQGQDRSQVQDLSQYQLPIQDMGDSNFGFSNLGGESTIGFSQFAAAAFSDASVSVSGGDTVFGGQGQGAGQRDVLSEHAEDSTVAGKDTVNLTATSTSDSGCAHDRRGMTATATGQSRGTGLTDQAISMPPPHAPYLSSAGSSASRSSSSSFAPTSSSSAPPSAPALLTPASIAKALSKVPPFARAGLKKQLELHYSQQLLGQLLHGGTGTGTGALSESSLVVNRGSEEQMQPLNQAERTEMLGNQWETHRQKVSTISSSSLLPAVAAVECPLECDGCVQESLLL
jgi:hypothetical protein